MRNQPVKIEDFKRALRAMRDTVDGMDKEVKYKIAFGIRLVIQEALPSDQTASRLSKFHEALSILKDDDVVLPVIEVLPVNPLEEEFVNGAQQRLTAMTQLAGGPSNEPIKEASAEQTQAVAKDQKQAKEAGIVKS